MDIRQLRYFTAIADAKSYSIAAKSLFVTQPTLTWTIQKLETELNTELFYHSDRLIELTESGKLLYKYGKDIVNQVDDLTNAIRGYENEKVVKGTLKVGLTVLFSIQQMQIIAEFISSHPKIETTLIQKGSKKIQEMVSTGELDIGLVSFPIYYNNLEIEPFSTPLPPYKVSVVVSKDNLLASRSKLKMKDLKDESFSLLSTDFILGNLPIDRCNEVGFEPHIIFQNDNWEVLLENIVISNSVTILPTDFSKIASRKDVKWIDLDDKIGHIDIGIIKRKKEKLSPPNLLFCNAIKQSVSVKKKGR